MATLKWLLALAVCKPSVVGEGFTGYPFDALASLSPWPPKPRFQAFHAGLDGGGRWMISDLLKLYREDRTVLLEIGGFLGGSMRRWLRESPKLSAVLLERDYFGQFGEELAETVMSISAQNFETKGLLGCCETALTSLDNMREADGAAHTLFSNLWEFRDRLVINFKGFPLGLMEVHRLGFIPDLVYIDTDKHMDELWVVHALWPGALLTGDDWAWGKARSVIMRFVRKFNYTLRVSDETWVVFAPSTSRALWRTPPPRPRGVAHKYWDIDMLNRLDD